MSTEYQMAVPIESHSHHLTQEAFSPLLSKEAYVWVSDISDTGLFLRARNHFRLPTRDDFIQFGHYSLSMMLIALNVGALGHFVWAANPRHPYPQYSILDPASSSPAMSMSVAHDFRYPTDSLRELHQSDVTRSLLIFRALAEEKEPVTVRSEYLKGIFHLGYSLVDLDFRREAFANFYRSLEFFVSRKVLKTERLRNELRSITAALRGLGIDEELIAEFSRLYQLRSEQVMHAQRAQVPMEWEDVIKLKVILDGVMNLYYRPVWEAAIGQPPKTKPEAGA